ncbi:MAG: hypothetical protein KDC44_02695 [Phaeodactylibacter sp.]|nr:hypothetical protein [Phaeodactylibacter sp.]
MKRVVLGILLVLALGALAMLPGRLERAVQQGIEDKGLPISYGDLQIRLFQRQIQVQGLQSSQTVPTKAARLQFKTSIDTLLLEGIQWWPLFRNKQLKANTLRIAAPQVQVRLDTAQWIDSLPQSGTKLDLELIVHEIDLARGFLAWEQTGPIDRHFQIEDIAAQLHPAPIRPGEAILPALLDAYEVELRCITTTDSNALHRAHIGQMLARSTDSSLQVLDLEVYPQFTPAAFNQRLYYKRDQLNVSVAKLAASGLDFDRLLEQQLDCRHLLIQDIRINDLADRNLPHNPRRRHPLPQPYLLDLPMALTIDSVAIRNGQIRYAEIPPGRKLPGYVDFTDLQADLYKISNDSLFWTQHDQLSARINCKLYGQAALYVNFQFPMQARPWTYHYQGYLHAFDMPNANVIMEQAADMRVLTGQVKSLSFQATANEQLAWGPLEFYYENLDVAFLKEKNGFVKNVVSDLVEWWAFPQENLKHKKHRIGNMHKQYDSSRSFFYQLWQTVLSGIQSVILPNIILPHPLKHEKVEGE